MTTPSTLPSTDHALAASIAEASAHVLMELRGRAVSNPTALGDEGDRLSHQRIMRELRHARPDDAVLSEHGEDGPARSSAPRVWVVDPLDGTREYGEGRPDFAVHVALVVSGRPEAGAVALPAENVVFATDGGTSPPSLPPRSPGRLRIVVSRTRPPVQAEQLADRLDGSLHPLGSAGAKVMAVLRGDADAYVHAGGQYEWDSAAPVAVATWRGAHASRLDGSPLVYNQPDPWLPDLLVCRPELAHDILAALGG